ncbi:MAG: 50S ribosomal protein L4 [Candidatus Shapirobacteria bacterium]
MKAPLYNIKAEKISEVTLPKIFDRKISSVLISRAIRVYLSNQRSAHAKVKDRGEVAGTTKKMWPQKGTGRARHGSAKAGIFVGGGSVHGPQGNQNYSLTLSKSQKTVARDSILARFAKNNSILIIEELNSIVPKTKEGFKLISSFKKLHELSLRSKIGIITRNPQPNAKRAFGNLPRVTLLPLTSLNSYDLANQNFLIFSQKAIESLK